MGRTPENSLLYRGAEFSKKLDIAVIALGSGLLLIGHPAGGPLILISVGTYLVAKEIQRRSH